LLDNQDNRHERKIEQTNTKYPWVVKPEQKSPRVGKYQSFYFCS